MRIFLALAASPLPGFASNLWLRNLHDPLVEMGHDVILWDEGIQPLFEADPDAPETAPLRTRLSERFVDAVERANAAQRIDLVLTYVGSSHLEPAAIDRVRERTAPVINFFCNNVHQFHLVCRVAPHFTANLVPEREALADYRAVGAEATFFPMAANPAVYRPIEATPIHDASFAGQRYADRASGILALREAGVDAHVFGPGWTSDGRGGATTKPRGPLGDVASLLAGALRGRDPLRAVRDRGDWSRLRGRHAGALHGPVSDADYVALFSLSRISLGFLLLGDTHRTRRPLRQVRLREFEAPMSGAFYLTDWIEELADHYEIGREIVCYRSHEELVERARYYLAHDSERDAIRRAGHQRARRDHTWQRRFEVLFERLARKGVL